MLAPAASAIPAFSHRLALLAADWARELPPAQELAADLASVAEISLAPVTLVRSLWEFLRLDREIALYGISAAAQLMLKRLYAGAIVSGDLVPTDGPTLVVGNHPGAGDSLSLLSSMGRDDVLVIARDRPMFRAMPALNRHLCLLAPGALGEVIRTSVQHLSRGGSVVLYPAGRIEHETGRRTAMRVWHPWSALAGHLAVRANRAGVQPHLMIAAVSEVHDPRVLQRWSVQGTSIQAMDRRATFQELALRAARHHRIRIRWSSWQRQFNGGIAPAVLTKRLREACEEILDAP